MSPVLRTRPPGSVRSGCGPRAWGFPTDRTPTEAVRLLAAVRSQEPAHAFWSLALRSTATTETQVRAAYDAGEFVRTPVLAPTWHFVAAEDVRWMLATTARRAHQANGSMLRERGVGPDRLDRGARALADALAGGAVLTRPELVTVLVDAGLPTEQLDVVLPVMHAELEQVVVSGPMRGATHTYALLDDRAFPAPRPTDPTRAGSCAASWPGTVRRASATSPGGPRRPSRPSGPRSPSCGRSWATT